MTPDEKFTVRITPNLLNQCDLTTPKARAELKALMDTYREFGPDALGNVMGSTVEDDSLTTSLPFWVEIGKLVRIKLRIFWPNLIIIMGCDTDMTD